MKFCITGKLVKGQLLCLGIVSSCYAAGYLVGHLNILSSSKAITQQPRSTSELAIPKDNTAMQIRLLVKRNARRLYVYRGEQVLKSFPIAIGKPGWQTPLGKYQVIYMEKDPIFINFKTDQIIKPGSKNPLGKRLIAFKIDERFDTAIHGTNQDELIGQAVSHGCIRMRNKDVIALYEMVNIGTSVTVLP
jgi:L,D-transpeptidase ErfK/SrfK